MLRVLIDADSIVFRCGFAVEHKKYKYFIKGEEHFGPFQTYDYKREIPKEVQEDPEVFCEVESECEPVQNALHLVRQEVEGIISSTGATSYSVYIKGKGNFREALSVTRVYKGNRDVTHRPKYEEEIRDYLRVHWGAEEVDGMETDDRVAMEQDVNFRQRALISAKGKDNDPKFKDWTETIIASIDKDLDQIPGWHYNFAKKEMYWITEEEAMRNFYTQLLVGDSSDNIQGVPGIGKVGAAKSLADCKVEAHFITVCTDAYKDAYGEKWEEVFIEMANLLWLRRSPEDTWRIPG